MKLAWWWEVQGTSNKSGGWDWVEWGFRAVVGLENGFGVRSRLGHNDGFRMTRKMRVLLSSE